MVEGEVAGVQERATQLQREKEKALADLNNIRKINRTIEKSVLTSYTYIYVHVHVDCSVYTCIHVVCGLSWSLVAGAAPS